MGRRLVHTTLAAIVILLFAAVLWSQAAKPGTLAEWKPVEEAMGRPGSLQPGDVFKFSMPRSDLKVSVEGVAIQPGLALGSWAAFKKAGNDTAVMGDLVLTDSEVEPVMKKLVEGGIDPTALHNHLLHETPRVLYMHIFGRGDAVKLAHAIHDALALTRTPPPAAPAQPGAPQLDQAQIEHALGHKGNASGSLLQFSIPRAGKITDHGMEVPPSMGVATAINFQPTGEKRAAITGDFVLEGSEVDNVIRALRQNGIEVTAVHSHMLMEEPRLFFLHFWANDDAVKLAHGLRAALDQTGSKK